ncbi:restriction endonuclease subunit S domain-containing protein [Roseomonas rosulenta]|uniref:hypothetical protein n=1 Tax=Roseomonas rosulenta TaxID=2748667 RepID=UPI0018DFB6D0|nr:hypothetical protein [Roseomonas rosulenta]
MPTNLPLKATFSLRAVARNPTLRIDAKQADENAVHFDALLDRVETFYLGEFLPEPFVKGRQPNYLEEGQDEGALVLNTGAVRPLGITFGLCRRVSTEDFEQLSESRKLKDGDVLLTTDGGTSIGKAAVFQTPLSETGEPLDCGFTVDSHVAILRPSGISSTLLSYLLCSPMGQIQFQRAESGASGQTAVSEDDVRRFRFPKVSQAEFDAATATFTSALEEARRLEAEAFRTRQEGWNAFQDRLTATAGGEQRRIAARARPSETRMRQAFAG